MGRGRKLAAAGDLEGAERAFDEAVRARPYDAAPRAERAYVGLRRVLALPEDQHAAALAGVVVELDLARALTRDRGLLAQIVYNLGLAHEGRGYDELARLAFVAAERLGSSAATAKLGAASRCTVSVNPAGDDLRFLSKWSAILREVGHGTCRAPHWRTEAEAREIACGGCTGYDEPWQRGACDEGGPVVFQTGYMHCSVFWGLVQGLGGGLYYVESAAGGRPEPLGRAGRLWVKRQKQHFWSWVQGYFVGGDAIYRRLEGWSDLAHDGAMASCPADESTGAPLEPSSGCQASDGAAFDDGEIRSYFDDQGRWLASLVLRDGDEARVTIRLDAKSLDVSGGGCALTVPFSTR
jgi:hypothetical protein